MSDAHIFQLIGIVYLSAGLGIIISVRFYGHLLQDYAEHPAVTYVSGLLALVVGWLLVTFHNIWVKDWPVIITVVGWIALVKGISLLVLPGIYVRICNAMKTRKALLIGEAVVVAAMGGVFAYLGYFVL